MMRNLLILVLGLLLMFAHVSPIWADSTATATVSTTITTVAEVDFSHNPKTSKGTSASQIVFSVRDDQDMGAEGSPAFMYAPPRSEAAPDVDNELGYNWHEAVVIANGNSTTLTVTVAGNIPSSALSVWCGGFWIPFAATPLSGTYDINDGKDETDDWRPLPATYTYGGPFIGVVPLSYRLNLNALPNPSSPSGIVTVTVSNT